MFNVIKTISLGNIKWTSQKVDVIGLLQVKQWQFVKVYYGKSLLWKRIKDENTEIIKPVQLKENTTIFK